MKKGIYSIPSFIILVLSLVTICSSSCKKEKEIILAETSTVVDIENNVYKTIKIGNQWWMAEDLKTTKYRNGNSLNFIPTTDNLSWSSDTTGACSQYDNNANNSGLLYNMYAVHNSNNLAPEGWHIPTDQEWKELEIYLGMSIESADKTSWRGTNEGDKLKITGPDNWKAYGEVWATNESGFTALAGGCRLFDGSISSPTGKVYMGFWWSSTEYSGNEAWYRYLDYKRSEVFRSHVLKSYGLSIRCVKD